MNAVFHTFFILLFLLLSVPVYSQTSSRDKENSAQIIHVEPAIYHLGTIPDSKAVSFSFSVTNQGDKNVKLVQAKTFCGCTIAELKWKELASGQSTEIKATFDPRGREGYMRWEIHLFIESDPKPVLLFFDTTVFRDAMLSHPNISFGTFRQGIRQEKKIWISPSWHPEFRIEKVEMDISNKSQYFQTSWERYIYDRFYPSPRPAQCLTIVVKPDIPLGNLEGKVKVFTDIPEQKVIEIPLSGRVCGEIIATPDYVSMGVVQKDKPIVRRVMVYPTQDSHTILIQEARVSLPFIQLQMHRKMDGLYYHIELTGPVGEVQTGEFRGQLVLQIIKPVVLEMVIPVQGVVWEGDTKK